MANKTSSLQSNEKYIAGMLLSLIILSLIYWPNISSLLTLEKPIFAKLCEDRGNFNIRVIDEERKYVNVPDYDADVYIEPRSDKINLNSNLEFSYKIIDKGIQKLNTSYFYILVFDPDDKLRAVFPCFCGQTQTDFSAGYWYTCYNQDQINYCSISSGKTKFEPWSKNTGWTQNGQQWSCSANYFCIDTSCIQRKSFINGEDNGRSLVYTFPADKIGTWKVYSFLFEEEYTSRTYHQNLDAHYFDNAVAYSTAKIEVINESEKGLDLSWFIGNAVTIVGTFLTVLVISNYLYEKLKEFVVKYKREIAVFMVLAVILTAVSFFFCKISCPV